MSDKWEGGDLAREAYETVAPFYDDFTRCYGYEYECWTNRLLALAEAAGLEGSRLLDIGCGTGLNFIPLLDRGWEVTGCDISPAMLGFARAKVGDRARLLVADMRSLPKLGEFDLIWAVNEPLNYLLSFAELEAALAGIRRNLAPHGLALFDVFTLKALKALFTSEIAVEGEGRTFLWSGRAPAGAVFAGSIVEARLAIEGEEDSAHLHRVRHLPEAEMLAAIEVAGLRCAGAFGECEKEMHEQLDEAAHDNAVYLCRL
jgi:SAM-dependent methyltransferase